MITPELRQQAIDKVKECKEIALVRTKIMMPPIHLLFDLKGNRAGVAVTYHNAKHEIVKTEVRINQYYLQNYTSSVLNNTIPHEMAHLLTNLYYGIVAFHGKEWQHIMRSVYLLEPERCHSYGLSPEAKKMQRWSLTCTFCHIRYGMTTRGRNKMIKKGTNRYWCVNCKNYFLPNQTFLLTTPKE